jgi:single-strand DNA-binding protein
MNRDHISSAELVGRLGQDPNLQHTEGGLAYTRLSLATSETFTSRTGEIHDRTEWHNAVAWGEKAEEIAKAFSKGDSVVLSGTLRVNSYEKDGAKSRVTELHVEDAQPNRDNQPSQNVARLLGEIREPPSSKTLDSGVQMTTLSLATKTMVDGRDGPREREDWHRVTLWGKAAEAARDINPGDTVAINGALRHRTVPGDDGQERKLSAIDCQRFQVLEHAMDRGARQRSPDPARESPKNELSAPSVADGQGAPRAARRSRAKSVDRGL